MNRRTLVLVVLDGWGLGESNESNPIYVVRPKNLTWLGENFPLTSLQASGINVGLPWGETGNSEVGHLTLGGGKVMYQYFPRISLSIREGSFFKNEALRSALAHARKNNSAVNLIGLLSDANTHASLEHLLALIKMVELENISQLKLHLFADGKDSPPKTLEKFLDALPQEKISTLTGRYYGMDRNQNWQLTKSAYDCLTGRGGEVIDDPAQAIQAHYQKGLNEEFLEPLSFGHQKAVADNDAVIFFNFREDSIRQISEAFITPDFGKFPVKKFQNLFIATMTRYEEKFHVPVAFPPETVEKPLGKVISDLGKTQLRLAETYKYAHVTYFFNGYREAPFKNEYRALIPSRTSIHPEEHPEMMAAAITDRLIQSIENQGFDFVLANYANPDTIAHTGNYQACLEAVRIIDKEMGRIMEAVASTPTLLIITSDHGNMEQVINPVTGRIETQHDPNPVPFYLMAKEFKNKKFVNWKNLKNETTGILSDVAPTILELMNTPKPKEMTGRSLLSELVL